MYLFKERGHRFPVITYDGQFQLNSLFVFNSRTCIITCISEEGQIKDQRTKGRHLTVRF